MQEQPVDEQALADGFVQGKPEAFEDLVRHYSPMLAEFAAVKIGNYHDAEDITQETFLRAFRYRQKFKKQSSLKPWLFMIAHRLIINGYRKKTLRMKTLVCQPDPDILRVSPHETVSVDWIWQAAAKTGKNQFTVLWLRYKQGMSIAEIAQAMHKSQLSIKVMLYRARQKLVMQLNEQPELTDFF